MPPPQAHQSHARETDIPGTVDLRVREGDEAHMGQALYPVPSSDPNDPLNYPAWKKNMTLAVCAFYSFLGNWAIVGPSVYIVIWAEQFGITPHEASFLVSYSNLAFGFGNYILVPAYMKFGRRPVLLGSQIMFIVFMVVCAEAKTFNTLMAGRVMHSFAASIAESLPVQACNDIFFIHERGKKIGYYTVCLCLGATAPFFSGYMLAGGQGPAVFFYVTLAAAAACFLVTFFCVEETMYVRKYDGHSEADNSSTDGSDKVKEGGEHLETVEQNTSAPKRHAWARQLRPWSFVNPEVDLVPFIWRPFTYLAVPVVLWVILVYGIEIGIGAFAYSYTFPIIIQAPPYNWSEINSGLVAIANMVGYFLAIPLVWVSDWWAAKQTVKNGGIREAEMRLTPLLVPLLIGPAGMLVYGLAAQNQLHWFAYFAGVAMSNFAAFFYFTWVLAYAVDSYSANLAEWLVITNFGKQAISFGMSLDLLSWILADGYGPILAGAFTAVLLFIHLLAVPFMLFGKKIRTWTAKSFLAKIHTASIKNPAEAH